MNQPAERNMSFICRNVFCCAVYIYKRTALENHKYNITNYWTDGSYVDLGSQKKEKKKKQIEISVNYLYWYYMVILTFYYPCSVSSRRRAIIIESID